MPRLVGEEGNGTIFYLLFLAGILLSISFLQDGCNVDRTCFFRAVMSSEIRVVVTVI